MSVTEVLTVETMRVPVEIYGGPDRPLLFLPGFGVHPRNYRAGLLRLSGRFTVIVPDLSFRSNRSLPADIRTYRHVVERLAERYAPEAPRTGHSFGGLLAMLGNRPAVGLAPMIPIRAGWARKVGRAALLQLREYAGLEGRRGIRWAGHIFGEYLRTALLNPGLLFPAVSETLGGIPPALLPTAPCVTLVLARRDRLYLQSEYDAYVAQASPDRLDTRFVPHGHDWPVTHPALVESELIDVLESGEGGSFAARSLRVSDSRSESRELRAGEAT